MVFFTFVMSCSSTYILRFRCAQARLGRGICVDRSRYRDITSHITDKTANDLPPGAQLQPHPVISLLSKLIDHKLDPAELKKETDDNGRRLINKVQKAISNGAPNSQVLKKGNYKDRFRIMLYLEEMQMRKELAAFNMSGAILVRGETNQDLLALRISGLHENRPCVKRNDRLYITLDKDRTDRYEGKVAHVNQNSVELLFDPRFDSLYKPGDRVSVQFDLNDFYFREAHRAIECMATFDFLFPSSRLLRGVKPGTPIEFFDQKIMSNPEQMQAVRNCLDGASYRTPYIIFGPPGTGKTATLIEIIKQLWLRANEQKYKILICTPSNSAADLITELLLQSIPVNDLYRLYSASRPYDTIPEQIKRSTSCNYGLDGEIPFFDIKKLKTYKIIVTTLVSSARLVGAGLGRNNHFSHIIVDESGQASEPETLIPISGLAGFKFKDDTRLAQIILAGDPKQLGPVTLSKLAVKLGLDISLIERLMDLDLYKKHTEKGYNPKAITKLVLNHRSHGALIEASNKLFYNNELKVNGDKKVINMAVGWSQLPNKNYPVIFHGVKGLEERERSSPSCFNRAEVTTVVKYVASLLTSNNFNGNPIKPEDVGIISPYRKQVWKLRQACESLGWDGVKIGSVEEFQGSEKLVTILSTVRSKSRFSYRDVKYNLGFLSNPKRFNVALTRARALMIVVGDPDVLLYDVQWRTFILLCRENGALARNGYLNEQALVEEFLTYQDPTELGFEDKHVEPSLFPPS